MDENASASGQGLTFGKGVPLQNPPTASNGDGFCWESDGNIGDGQLAVLEHRFVGELVGFLDLVSCLPPQAHGVHELRVVLQGIVRWYKH